MDNQLLDKIAEKLRALPDQIKVVLAQDLPHAEACTVKSHSATVVVFGHKVTAETVSDFSRSQQSLHTEIGILLQTARLNHPEGTEQPAMAEAVLKNLLGFRPLPDYSTLTLTSAAFLPDRQAKAANQARSLYLMLFEVRRLYPGSDH